jgi:heme exporter protein C
LFIAPPDYLQGEGFRIIYVHVPCAMLSMLLYVTLAIASAIFLIWRIKIADMVAYCVAPIGALFTFCALVTGAIWGKPMWGTWWIWDARLTSELILLFLYIGYIGLYQAIANPKSAAKISAIFAVIGLIDIPIIHYSVYWWNTLHQGATISRFAKPSMDSSMLWPLLSMIVGIILYTIAIMCWKLRSEILVRGSNSRWIQSLIANKL